MEKYLMDQAIKFSKTHEWVKIENEHTAYVGISNHAQEALGDILFLKLPDIGSCLKQGQACATIESLKAASDIHAPISGVVAEINAAATENPERINTQPYDVWLFKIKVDEEATSNLELASLMPNQQYESGLNN